MMYGEEWLKMTAQGYLEKHPDWTPERAMEEAIVLRREMHRMDMNELRSDRRFQEMAVLVGRGMNDPGEETDFQKFMKEGSPRPSKRKKKRAISCRRENRKPRQARQNPKAS
jgi:hypothetical protein